VPPHTTLIADIQHNLTKATEVGPLFHSIQHGCHKEFGIFSEPVSPYFYLPYRALIAIINAVKPGIAQNASTLDPKTKRENCIMASKIAQTYLKIPQIISPEDLSGGNVDERSIMTYLSYFVEPFRAKLLKWVQRILPQCNIKGFSEDWHSGRVFGVMVRACCSGVISDWDQLEGLPDDEYIEKLFTNVKKKLGITPPFETSDLISGNLEELQIMTMVMLIRSGDLVPLSDEIIVSGRGIEEAYYQQDTSFLIDISEAGPGELFIDAVYEDDDQQLKFSLTEKTSKVYSLTYTPIQTGRIVFSIQWSNEDVPQSPFIVPVTDATLVNIVDFESNKTTVEMGKSLCLLLDTVKAGEGHLNAYFQHGREKIQAAMSTLANGKTEVGYTPTRPGTYVLHILWNKKELNHLSVTYSVVDVRGYVIESPPQDKAYSVYEELGFWVTSEKGLPLNVLEITAILDLDMQIPIKLQTTGEGRGYASFMPTLPGVYRIEIVCVNQFIQGTPFNVRVSDPHSCKVKGTIPTHLEIGKPHIFEINIKEAGMGAITFDSSDHDISTIFKVHFKDLDSTDVQKLEVTPLTEGSFLVGIKYENKWISNSPFRLQICDPSKFRVVEKLTTAKIGRPIEFNVVANKACTDDVKLVIKANGPSAKYSPQIQVSDDGLKHSVKFIPWEIGDHEILIQYGGFDIPNCPIFLPVTSFDADACSAAGSGLQKAYSGIPARFLVLSRQEGLLDDDTLEIRVSSVLDDSDCNLRARDNKNGTYSIAYLVHKPGAYLISIITDGHHIPGSPFRLNALPGPDAHKCKMYGPALSEDTILTFGKPIDFSIDTSKAGTGKLAVKAIGPESTPARVFVAKAGQPGKYDVSIDALRHGKHRVNVKWSGSHIPGSPFTIKVFPGADPRKCTAQGPGLEDGWVGKKSSFTIDTKNAGAGVLKVRLHGVKDAFKIEMAPVDHKNRRTLLANYSPTQPGEYLIMIKWSDMHIPGSPFRVKITGDGTKEAPTTFAYTPTPRLPEVSGFLADSEELGDTDEEDTVKHPPLRQPPANRAGKKVVRRKRRKKVARPGAKPGAKPTRKREYEGQVTLRVPK
jgi:filamin